MLLRYGINNFWSNSISTSRMLYLPSQINCFFNVFLRNSFLMPLKIQYKKNIILIYVFYYKNKKMSFLRRYFIWKKIKLKKLILRKQYNLSSFIKKSKKKNKKKIINVKLLLLIEKIYLIKYFHKHIKLENNNFFYVFKKQKKIIKNLKYKKNKKIKLKKINFLLKIKKLSLIAEIILNSYIYNNYKIAIKTATKKINYNKMPFFFKYIKNENQKKNTYLLILAFFYNKSFIINLYVANIIKLTKNKKHIKNIVPFINVMKLFFDKQFVSFTGYKFFISGRLNGKLRKSSFGFKLGSLKLLSFSTNVNYSCDIVHTQYGCFSLKSWLCSKTND